jgi:hypothetical protein
MTDNVEEKDYVVVTCISSFRIRYVMHKDDLQKLNPSEPVNAIEWANDTVTAEECEEFSQKHMGEYITDTTTMNEDEILELFDKDNDYLKGWDKNYKVEWIRKTIIKTSDWKWTW